MNIAYVSREFGPVTGGGIGTYVDESARCMAGRGHQVFLVTDCVDESRRHLLPPGVRLLPVAPVRPERRGGYISPFHEYADRVHDTLQAALAAAPLDVVEFADFCGEGYTAIQAKRTLGAYADTRLLIKVHTSHAVLREINGLPALTSTYAAAMHLEHYALRHADRVLSPTRALADYVRRFCPGLDIDLVGYPYTPPAAPTPVARDPRHVLFAATLQPRKGPDVFIRAALQLLERDDGLTFHLAGRDSASGLFQGSYRRELERMIPPARQPRFVWHGPLEHARLTELFHRCGVCVVPSRWENFAYVCLEAMLAGCVVVGSNTGGTPEMIEDGRSGFLFDLQDPDSLARVLGGVLRQPETFPALGRAAVERARSLTDPDRVGADYEAAYRRPLSRTALRASRARVSVVIPLYNQGGYVEEAVASVRASTHPDVEIVVVDDGSTDAATRSVFDRLDGVVKIRQENRGLAAARNAGWQAARGDYILPLDADDRIEPTLLAKAAALLDARPELAYAGCYTRYFEAVDHSLLPLGYTGVLSFLQNTEGSCTKLFRREALARVGGYDEMLPAYEDWDLILRLNLEGLQGDVIPEPLFLYRQRDGSMNFMSGFLRAADLMQFIHHKLRPRLSPADQVDLHDLLLEHWKTAERIAAGVSEFKVYYTDAAAPLFDEQQTARTYYPLDRWTTLTLDVPGGGRILLRVDPNTRSGLVWIRRLAVLSADDDRVLWQADSPRALRRLAVAGTAMQVWDRRRFGLLSTGEDPQIILPPIDTAGAGRLRVIAHVCCAASLAAADNLSISTGSLAADVRRRLVNG